MLCVQVICFEVVVRGMGKQVLGTTILFVSWYLVAWPVVFSLMFAVKMGLMGLWLGYTSGVTVQTILLFIVMFTCNWQKESELVSLFCILLYCAKKLRCY